MPPPAWPATAPVWTVKPPAPVSASFFQRLPTRDNRVVVFQDTTGDYREVEDSPADSSFGSIRLDPGPVPEAALVPGLQVQMEKAKQVLSAINPGDWMVSIDLKDAYSQVPFTQSPKVP